MKKYNWGVAYSPNEAYRFNKNQISWADLASNSKESQEFYMTLDEIAKELKVSRERIRQIEHKALMKLKHPKRSKLLSCFLDSTVDAKDLDVKQKFLFAVFPRYNNPKKQ